MKVIDKSKIKAIFFDLDDTLYDRSQYELEAYNYIDQSLYNKYGINKKKIYKNLIKIKDIYEYNYRNLFASTSNLVCIPEKNKKNFVKDCLKYYRKFKPSRLKLYPGTISVLNKLKKSNYFVGIITNGNVNKQRIKIKTLRLKKYIRFIIYARNFGKKNEKPSSYSFKYVLKKLKIKSEEMIYIGDNPKIDYTASVRAKINFLRIKKGEYKSIKYNEKKIKFIKNLREIFKFI
tara:strand:- start:7868 stop:8566 length:699 start_codon:yes stop_codon:yes gene_type:complete